MCIIHLTLLGFKGKKFFEVRFLNLFELSFVLVLILCLMKFRWRNYDYQISPFRYFTDSTFFINNVIV